jgi:hypothetical protein
VQQILQQAAANTDEVARFFGRYITTPRMPLAEPREPEISTAELIDQLEVRMLTQAAWDDLVECKHLMACN